jgi:membrane protease YdiL (CAAX protease family)
VNENTNNNGSDTNFNEKEEKVDQKNLNLISNETQTINQVNVSLGSQSQLEKKESTTVIDGMWGPPEVKKTKPVGMGDVVSGLILAQVFGAIPFIAAIIFIVTRLSDVLNPAQTSDIIQQVLAAGPILVASMLASWMGFMLPTWWAALNKGDKNWRELLKWRFNWKRDLLIAVVFVLVLRSIEIVIGLILQNIFGLNVEELSNAGIITQQSGIWLVLIALGAAFGAPVVEEIFFRGLFLSVAVRNWGAPIGIIVSSVVFGILHAQASVEASIYTITSTTIVGLVLAILVLKTNRLGTAITAHLLFNTSGVILILLSTQVF